MSSDLCNVLENCIMLKYNLNNPLTTIICTQIFGKNQKPTATICNMPPPLVGSCRRTRAHTYTKASDQTPWNAAREIFFPNKMQIASGWLKRKQICLWPGWSVCTSPLCANVNVSVNWMGHGRGREEQDVTQSEHLDCGFSPLVSAIH